MKLAIQLLLWVIVILNSSPLLRSQNSEFLDRDLIFDHYLSKEGFPSYASFCVLKSSTAYVWIATNEGLVKYDGQEFIKYTFDPLNDNSVSVNYIRKILEDKHGRIWIMADKELNVFDVKKDTFYRLRNDDPSSRDVRYHPLCFYYEEALDKMWIGTTNGLYYNIGKPLDLIKMTGGPVISSAIECINKDKEGYFWIGHQNGFSKFLVQNNQINYLSTFALDTTGAITDAILTSFIDDNNILWLGSWRGGLIRFDIKTNNKKQFLFAPIDMMLNQINSIVSSTIKEENNILWLGTNYGLLGFNTQTKQFDYKLRDKFNNNLSYGVVFDFCMTKSEGLWIAAEFGLHRYDPNKQKFISHKINLPGKLNQAAWVISSILKSNTVQTADSILYVFIPYIGLFSYDLMKRMILPVHKNLMKYCGKDIGILSLFMDSENILWIGTTQHGIMAYDIQKNKFLIPPNLYLNQSYSWVQSITEDKYKNLWFGTFNGVWTFDRKQMKISESKCNKYLNSTNIYNYINYIASDQNGNLWISARGNALEKENALICYDPIKDNSISIFRTDNVIFKILNLIEGINTTSFGKLLISSYNGLAVCDIYPPFSGMKLFTTKQGLLDNRAISITEDKEGYIWISSTNGLSRLNISDEGIMNFPIEHFASNSIHQSNLCYSNASNTIYYAIGQYIHTISLNEIAKSPLPVIQLKYVKVDNQILSMQSDSTFGKKLKYNQNNIEFNLTQLNFTNSDQNLFRYMLEGAETHWNTSKSNIIHYYALAPGDYRFKAKAINYQGSLSENQLNIDFTINPPFWFSWWFQSIILIVISSILFILFKYREKQIKKLNSLRLSIARDMHDDMGSNLSNIKMLSELELIKSNTNPKESFRKIAEKTNQVMQSMSEIVWSINPSNDTMDSIILKIQEFAIDVLETQGIELKFDIEHTVSQAKLDLEERRHFYLIFKELINNAAKYSKATEVVLIIYYRHKRLSVIFSDNGIGFNSLLVNSGNGLKNLQSRVKLLNSHINIQSDENGTKVQFDLLC